LILSQNELSEKPNDNNSGKCAATETITTSMVELMSTGTEQVPTTTTFSTINFNENLKNEHEDICLDDFVEESYNKIITGVDKTIISSPPSTDLLGNDMLHNSPLSALHHSHTDNINIPINFPSLEIMNDDSIKELLYGNAS
jgi:hypothetical protein